ncbi:thiol reductant ABC exporter subunit CydC [Allobranchiibius sp. GilTou73]|uniref:thiol reductant ABC exporter subunit CydC n=1 Tax=Allobranchiibius sp. GilTou73 TaxID=2904523 RepID=UPI001F34193F|nr:thiol reductant ABC exporter subunit CydC [Allobranchiibius sp. GilTou73]UIJ35324.1 thiol reductant ABC exporter subunit CydC [Allobranchiibius sp. GilTou73]
MAAPFDPRLLQEVPQTRGPVAALGILGVAQGIVAIAQAVAVAHLVVALVERRSLTAWALTVLTLLAVRGLLSAAGEVTAAWAGTRVAGLLRRRVLTAWLHRPVDTSPDPTTMLTRSTIGADSVEPYVARYLPALVSAAVVPPLAIAAMVWVDWVSALIVVLTVPLLPLFAALIGMHTHDETQARWVESHRLAGHFVDVMRGLPTLVNYQRADAQVDVVAQVGERHRRATVRTLRTAFLSSAALELLATISVAIVAVFVGLRLTYGSISLTVALTAILLAPEAYWPIRRVGQEFHSAADGAEAIDALLDEAVHTPRSTDGEPVRRAAVTGLSYRYPGTDVDVLRGVSFDVSASGITAVTGPSGCGKTTLLELLAGLRTPTSGDVVATVSHLVTQRPFVTPGTLRDNLGIADLPDGVDWLPAPLRTLPAGLDTLLGDDGYGLSAGQRALLALTRARLGEERLILLDEPTAHLDPAAAYDVHTMIRELATTRAVVLVTHDPELMAVTDRRVDLPLRLPVATARQGVEQSSKGADISPPPGDIPTPRREEPAARVGPGTIGALLRPAPGVLRAAVLGGLAATCGVALTATSGWLIVQASARPVILTLLTAIVAVRAFGIGRPIFRYVERIRSHDAALHLLADRRTDLYRTLIPLTPARLGRRRRADLLGAVVRDVDDEVDVQVRAIVPLLAAAMTCLVATVAAAVLYPPAALVVVAIALVAALIGAIDWTLERAGHGASLSARGAVTSSASTISLNTAALQAIRGDAAELARLDAAQLDLERAVRRQARGRAAGLGLSFLLTAAAAIGMAILLLGALANGDVGGPFAALLVLGPVALTDILGSIPDAVGALARGQAARRRLDTLVRQTPAVHDNGRTAEVPAPTTLQLSDVAASWTDGPDQIHGIDLRVAPGEHIAVTGPNGIGKSTVLAVLARHLDPSRGRYDVAGRDALVCRPDDVRRHVAVVDDEPHLFAGSLRANLLLARPGASDSQVASALVDAGLGRWVAGLPDGLDTLLGSDARGVSGGERTRIAIARAVLANRRVILLDEPVAHLDHPTASALMRDLHDATRDASVVVVSHQQIGVQGCDRVIELGREDIEDGGGAHAHEWASGAR